jgi:hypothetical protein
MEVLPVRGNSQARSPQAGLLSQFGRMCGKLGIRIIAASSPQAKGRVERVHGTHQDRLVKKLRLAGVAGYDDANRVTGTLPSHFSASVAARTYTFFQSVYRARGTP